MSVHPPVFFPIAGFAVYAASKAYVTAFSEAFARGSARQGRKRLRALSRPGAHRVHANRTTPGRQPYMAAPEFRHVSVESRGT